MGRRLSRTFPKWSSVTEVPHRAACAEVKRGQVPGVWEKLGLTLRPPQEGRWVRVAGQGPRAPRSFVAGAPLRFCSLWGTRRVSESGVVTRPLSGETLRRLCSSSRCPW